MTTIHQTNPIPITPITYHAAPLSTNLQSHELQGVQTAVEQTYTLAYSTIPRVIAVNNNTNIAPVQYVSTVSYSTFTAYTMTKPSNLQPRANAGHYTEPADVEEHDSDNTSETSYDSNKEKNMPNGENKDQKLDLKEPGQKEEVKDANIGDDGEPVGAVEVAGFGTKDHYMSKGEVAFKVKEVKFNKESKGKDSKKPYVKIRMSTHSKKGKNLKAEGEKMGSDEEIKVKYTNQDMAVVKLKHRGKLGGHSVLAVSNVSLVDVIKNEKDSQKVPLLKKDEIVGWMKLEMQFLAKK